MTGNDNRAPAGKAKKPDHPGMMGDGTEEQNLNQPGDPSARIDQAEVEDAFGKKGKHTTDGVEDKTWPGDGEK